LGLVRRPSVGALRGCLRGRERDEGCKGREEPPQVSAGRCRQAPSPFGRIYSESVQRSYRPWLDRQGRPASQTGERVARGRPPLSGAAFLLKGPPILMGRAWPGKKRGNHGQVERRQEGGACLFGRPRHLDHPEVAPDRARRGGG